MLVYVRTRYHVGGLMYATFSMYTASMGFLQC